MVMMLLLGMIDILAALSLGLAAFGFPFPHLQAGMALGLIAKGIAFFGDALSMLDIAIGIAMFVLLWIEFPMLSLGMAIYLVLKGIYSLA